MFKLKKLKYPFSIIMLFFMSVCYANSDNTQYRIVLDAGSTKTTVFLYQYDYQDALPSNISIVSKSRITPGIADVANSNMHEYLSRIFTNKLAISINEQVIGDGKVVEEALLSRVQFYSTAGMRDLPIQEQTDKNLVIRNWINNWVSRELITLTKTNVDVRTISGEEEASYAWVATNYLANGFQGPLQGSLELGGASTQIAYQDIKTPNALVEVGNKKYRLTGLSYPLGQNVISRLLSDIPACYLKGYSSGSFDNYTGHFMSNAYTNESGNYTRCRIAAKAMIDDNVDIITPNATKVSHYQVLTNFIYSAKFFGIVKDYSLSRLQQAGEKFCNLTWADAKDTYPDVNEEYLALYCMGAAYQGALLEDSYHFTQTKQSLSARATINGTKVTWPLGVLVSQFYKALN